MGEEGMMEEQPLETNEEDDMSSPLHDMGEEDNTIRAAVEASLVSREIDRACASFFTNPSMPSPRPNILRRFINWLRKPFIVTSVRITPLYTSEGWFIADKPMSVFVQNSGWGVTEQTEALSELFEQCGDTPEFWGKREKLIIKDRNDEMDDLNKRYRDKIDKCIKEHQENILDLHKATGETLADLAEDKAKSEQRSTSQPPQSS